MTLGRPGPGSRIVELDGVIRPYAWGSRTAIPELLGVAPDDSPAAELWFGAHPDDPSHVPVRGATLDKLIDADPAGMLGAPVVARFGPRLPFLVKVLAAETALSIQVHPNLEQARAGFAAEDARDVPRDAPERNYRDANHKPELLCALTGFDALCGFRPVPATLRLLDALDVRELAPTRELLARDGLRAAFSALLTCGAHALPVEAVVGALPRLAGTEWARLGVALSRVAADFPGDHGLAVALLLNFVRLAPGEAIFLGAGNVHSYLHGVGVEVLANSDNVLRCGLTPKHVDVPELLRVTDFRELAEPRCPARDGRFDTPVPDFALARVDGAADLRGPAIVLAADAPARVEAGGDDIEDIDLARGRAAFVSAGPATVMGRAFVTTVGT